MVNIYIDMDGTLARFYEHADCLERMWDPRFFAELNPYWNIVKGIRTLTGTSVKILSAINKEVFSVVSAEKKEWLAKYLPEIQEHDILFTEAGSSKTEIFDKITPNMILLDDYNANLRDWREHGGTAVKFVNEINDRGTYGPLWDGERIRFDYSPDRIAQELLRLSGKEREEH